MALVLDRRDSVFVSPVPRCWQFISCCDKFSVDEVIAIWVSFESSSLLALVFGLVREPIVAQTVGRAGDVVSLDLGVGFGEKLHSCFVLRQGCVRFPVFGDMSMNL